MMQPDEQTNIKLPLSNRKRQQQRQPLWFWPLLTAGSLAAHLLLVHTLGAMALQARSYTGGEALRSITPIDLVNLLDKPGAATAQPAQSTSAIRSPQSAQAPSSQSAISAALPSTPTLSTPTFVAARPNAIAVQPAPAPPKLRSPQAGAQSIHSAAKPVHPVPRAEQTLPELAAIASPQVNPIPSPIQPAPAVNPEATRLPSQAISTPVTPAITPTPLIATQPIDVPVPDVSETLPVAESPIPTGITGQVIIPSRLVANLTAEPVEQNNPLIDRAAHPKTEVQTFSSNPVASPCAVRPEAVRVLGETVAMEVMTDAKGKVINTVMQKSSQNAAYDELATCLVKHWGFEPAIAQSEPVANDGLVVRITIDRGS